MRPSSCSARASRSRRLASSARWRWAAASCPVTVETTRNSTRATHSWGSATVKVCSGWTWNQSKARKAATEAKTAGPLPKRTAVGSTTSR